MNDKFSADTDDLDYYGDSAALEYNNLTETTSELWADRSYLATLPLQSFVEDSVLDDVDELIGSMAENARYVADVSSALKDYGFDRGDGVREASAARIDRALAETDEERLDGFEEGLIEGGMTPEEAAKLRSEVEQQLDDDPTMSFNDAAIAGAAAYEGIAVEEFERRAEAFQMNPGEVGVIIDDNFDAIAGQSGDKDKITVEDAQAAAEDASLSPEVRAAAYRLAADGTLFLNMDVTKQTNLTDEPLTNGFRWNKADGEISRDDAEQFPDKEFQARILLAWHPLLDTANQDYNLDKADSQVKKGDVKAFLSDEDIPLHVRVAVYDTYAEKFDLYEQGEDLDAELAAVSAAGGVATLPVRVPPGGGPGVTPRPVPRPGPVAPPAGGAPAGGGGGAVVVAAVAAYIGAVVGWEVGTSMRVKRTGDPTFVHTDPKTGVETAIDPIELEGLSPAQKKAYVEYFYAHGEPPPPGLELVVPYGYVDAQGKWRMSDTDLPDWDGEHVELERSVPPHVYVDPNGKWRYRSDGHLFDGYELSPTERPSDAPGAADRPPGGHKLTDEEVGHILDGDEEGGFHHREGGVDPENAQVVRISKSTKAKQASPWYGEGVYKADVKIAGGETKSSTFFPDTYSRQQVVDMIESASRNKGPGVLAKNKEAMISTGWSADGYPIVFVEDLDGNLLTAYPDLSARR